MADWKHGESKSSAFLEILGWVSMSVSVFLVLFGAAVWAQDTIAALDAKQNQDIAVLTSQMAGVHKDIAEIKDRLFSVLLTAVGAVLASITSSVFSIRTHQRLKNGTSV